MGNIYGRLAGANASAPAVATGSHTDAIPLAGAYDGTLGALLSQLFRTWLLFWLSGLYRDRRRCTGTGAWRAGVRL